MTGFPHSVKAPQWLHLTPSSLSTQHLDKTSILSFSVSRSPLSFALRSWATGEHMGLCSLNWFSDVSLSCFSLFSDRLFFGESLINIVCNACTAPLSHYHAESLSLIPEILQSQRNGIPAQNMKSMNLCILK